MEHHYAAHKFVYLFFSLLNRFISYHPLPCVIDHSQGVYVWDVEGKQYFDFLSAYSALNQGHNHPKIVKALSEQAARCALTSRAFYNSQFPVFAKFVTELLGVRQLKLSYFLSL